MEEERESCLLLPHLSKPPGLSGKDSTQRRSLHFIDIYYLSLPFTPYALSFLPLCHYPLCLLILLLLFFSNYKFRQEN